MSDWKKEKAELLARQHTPGVKNKYWSERVRDLADGIEAALKEAEERGRQEEREEAMRVIARMEAK